MMYWTPSGRPCPYPGMTDKGLDMYYEFEQEMVVLRRSLLIKRVKSVVRWILALTFVGLAILI